MAIREGGNLTLAIQIRVWYDVAMTEKRPAKQSGDDMAHPFEEYKRRLIAAGHPDWETRVVNSKPAVRRFKRTVS